jgi:excisionase family DNA binding protein
VDLRACHLDMVCTTTHLFKMLLLFFCDRKVLVPLRGVTYPKHSQFMKEDPCLSKPRTVDEVASYLSCTRDFVIRQIEDGRLRAIKLGSKFIRIWPEDFINWIKKGGTTSKAESEHAVPA